MKHRSKKCLCIRFFFDVFVIVANTLEYRSPDMEPPRFALRNLVPADCEGYIPIPNVRDSQIRSAQ